MTVIVAGRTATRSRRSASLRLTCYLALFLLLNAFALNSVLGAVSPQPYKETVLSHTSDVLNARGCDDSWSIMAVALQYARSPHTVPIYAEIVFNRNLKFQYPPSSLFAIAAMLWLVGPELVRTQECQVYEFVSLNDALGWLFILLSAVSTAVLLERGLRQRFAAPASAALFATRTAVVFGLALTFYPIVKAFTLGQIQVWLNGIFAVALLCWALGWKASSGVLIGLVCLVKPHYALFVLWAALRREWQFTVACVAMSAIGLAASIATFGWADNVDYLRVFWFISQRGEVFYPNQSFNGLLNRIMTLFDPDSYYSLRFNDNTFLPFNAWIYAGTLITSFGILSTALFRRRTEGDPDRTVDFCTMALSLTIASPIAWEHHYGILLPVFAVLFTSLLASRTRLALMAGSYVLISNFFPVANMLAPTVLNVAQSYLFFAALVVLILLHKARSAGRIGSPASVALSAQPQ